MKYKTVDGKEMSADSSVNQRIKDRFVHREVHYCVSQLISEMNEKMSAFEEFPGLFERLDWDEVVLEFLEDKYKEDKTNYDLLDADDQEDFWGLIDELADEFGIVGAYQTPQEFLDELKAENMLERFGWDEDIEPDRKEPYEFWLVSDYLARKLEERGEIVEHDFYGLTIWGRTCTGQSIMLDWVISDICADLEILEGQRNSWEDR